MRNDLELSLMNLVLFLIYLNDFAHNHDIIKFVYIVLFGFIKPLLRKVEQNAPSVRRPFSRAIKIRCIHRHKIIAELEPRARAEGAL